MAGSTMTESGTTETEAFGSRLPGKRALMMLMAVWFAMAASCTAMAETAPGKREESREHSRKSGQITLAWNPVAGAGWYNLYYSTSPGVTPGRSRKIGRITATRYTVRGLKMGTTYHFVVTAAENGIESPISAEVSGKPEPAGGKKKGKH